MGFLVQKVNHLLVQKTEVAGQNMEDIELAGDPELAAHEKTKKHTQTTKRAKSIQSSSNLLY